METPNGRVAGTSATIGLLMVNNIVTTKDFGVMLFSGIILAAVVFIIFEYLDTLKS